MIEAPPATDRSLQKERMRGMFDAVAPRYDLLNRLLSAGIDQRWRARAVSELALSPGQLLVDLCTGTGDLVLAALAAQPDLRVIGVDLAHAMLVRALPKPDRHGGVLPVFLQGDAERLPLPDGSADRASVGFGIRNVSDVDACLREVARVLKPGGRFVILEFTTPPNVLFRGVYHAYFHHLLPFVGRMVSGHQDAYRYLPESVAAFPEPAELAAKAQRAGFSAVRWSRLHGGIAALHVCDRA